MESDPIDLPLISQAAAAKAATEAAAKAAKIVPKPVAPTPPNPSIFVVPPTPPKTDSTVTPPSQVTKVAPPTLAPVVPPNAQPATPAISGKSEAGGSGFVAGAGDVVVDIKNSESGYNNKIYWSADNFKTKNYLGIDNNAGTYNIGKFAEGTKIDFGIDNGVGNFFRTGTAANNADNIEHAKATQTAAGTEIGFEDLYGGGDRDFNDAIINVKNMPALKIETPVDTKPTAPKPDIKVDDKVTPVITPPKPDIKVEDKVTPLVTPPKPEIKVEDKVTPLVTPPKPEIKVDDKVPSDNTNRSGLGDYSGSTISHTHLRYAPPKDRGVQ